MAVADGYAGKSAFVGRTPAILRVAAQIELIGPAPVSVLILGETGTGKEICAAAIARLSGKKPYVSVNCATFSDTLADSELFGYDRGAFTGAYKARVGLVAEADGGILFLDELAEISLAVQAKLLRTLESGEYRKVGATKTRRSNFRLLAATNGNPDDLVAAGKLRADLVFRLGAARITLPPLRDRVDDIPLLAHLFLSRYRDRAGSGPRKISLAARELLISYGWPGNVRQLRNVIEAAAAIAGSSDEIDWPHVSDLLGPRDTAPESEEGIPTLAQTLRRAEAGALLDALQRSKGNRARAAEMLGISDATLYRKLTRHELSTIPG